MQNISSLLSGNFTIISVEVQIITDSPEVETSTEHNLLLESQKLIERLLGSTEAPPEPPKPHKEMLSRYGESDKALLINSILFSVFCIWMLFVYPIHSYMYKKMTPTHKKMQIFLIVNHFHKMFLKIIIIYLVIFIALLGFLCTGHNDIYYILYLPISFPLTVAEVYQTVMIFVVLTETLSFQKSFKVSEKSINRCLLFFYVSFILTGIIISYVGYYEFIPYFQYEQPSEILKIELYYPLCFNTLHNVIGNFELLDECFICKQVDTFSTFLLMPFTYLICFRSDLKVEIARLKMKKMIKNVYLPCHQSNKTGIAYNI